MPVQFYTCCMHMPVCNVLLRQLTAHTSARDCGRRCLRCDRPTAEISCDVVSIRHLSPPTWSTYMRLSHVLRLAHLPRIRLLRLPPRKPSRLSRPLWHTILGLRITLIGEPSSVVDMCVTLMRARSGTVLISRPKAAFYGVAVGRKPGVYHSWAEAEAQVKGYPAYILQLREPAGQVG